MQDDRTKEILQISEKEFGLQSVYLRSAVFQLAFIYRAQKRFTDAALLLKKLLTSTEQARGLDHPVIGDILDSLASTLELQNNSREAIPLRQRIIQIYEKAYGLFDFRVASQYDFLFYNFLDINELDNARAAASVFTNINVKNGLTNPISFKNLKEFVFEGR